MSTVQRYQLQLRVELKVSSVYGADMEALIEQALSYACWHVTQLLTGVT